MIAIGKTELYELVQALHHEGASLRQCAEILQCSRETVRTVLVNLGLDRKRSSAQILQSLNADLKRRVEICHSTTRQQQATAQHA
jgi:orotate phosphoribosyltransferase-like protein